MSHRVLSGLSVAVLFLVAGCSTSMRVSLDYEPTAASVAMAAQIHGACSVVVTDQRARKDCVGQNVQGSTPRLIVTRDNPTDFVRDVVVSQLEERRASVAEAGAPARRRVTVQLVKFFASESDMYRSEVQLKAQVLGEDNAVRWEGTASGASEDWGRSFRKDNYQQSLSNATYDAVTVLLNDPGLVAAMK